MSKKKRDVYVAIVQAAKLEKGLRLTADEVFELSCDEAILTAAEANTDWRRPGTEWFNKPLDGDEDDGE